MTFPEAARLLNEAGWFLLKRGLYEQALPLLQRTLAIREQQLGPDHPDTAQSLNNLAVLYERQEDYEQAKSLYERALAILEKTFDSNHPNTRIVQENLARLIEDMKKKRTNPSRIRYSAPGLQQN